MHLEQRSVVLTGATGGLGRAMARALAARGARLTLTGRRADVLAPLAGELGARSLTVDLADHDAVDALAGEVEGCDVLVANAALPGTGRLDELDRRAIDRALDVNLRAPMLLARAAVTGMRARGEGHIVLISSVSGIAVSPHASVYAATKAGLRGFGLALREELHGTGVGVSLIYPGPVRDAGMFADTGVTIPAAAGSSSPQDVARAVVRAVERDRAEITVASLLLRTALPLALVAPGLNAAVQRRFGAHRTAADLALRQSHKR